MEILGVYQPGIPAPRIENDTLTRLQIARDKVGQVIAKRPFEWRQVVALRDSTKKLSEVVPCINRAYFKCAELCNMIEISPRKIVHLCEAPGGFAEFCSQRYPGADAAAFSLEGAGSIAFVPTVKCTHANLPNDGDICNAHVMRHIVRTCPGGADLVTGDGGRNIAQKNMDIEEQICTRLFLAQVLTTVSLQNEGGCCFIKFFEGATKGTIDIIKAMRHFYASVRVTKPRSSRASNSERYLVCCGFSDNQVAYMHLKRIYMTMSISESVYLYSALNEPLSPGDLSQLEVLAAEQIDEIEFLVDTIATQDYDKLTAKRDGDIAFLLNILKK